MSTKPVLSHVESPNSTNVPEGQVALTTNYSAFKRLPGNRDIDTAHVANLVNKMKKKYRFSPIQVNQNFEIIDGQHRIEAHKRLALPIPFVWTQGGDLEDVQQLNSSQKPWNNDDYTDSYIERGYQDYATYKAFKESYKLPHSACVLLLTGDSRGSRTKFINGEFKVKNLELAKQKAVILSQVGEHFTHWKDRDFIYAMNTALNREGFDIQTFLHRLAANSSAMVPCVSKDQYLQRIEDVYNFGTTKKTPIKLGRDNVDSVWRS